MITELNKRPSPEWAGGAIEKSVALHPLYKHKANTRYNKETDTPNGTRKQPQYISEEENRPIKSSYDIRIHKMNNTQCNNNDVP
jgi:hypothetical protein